MTTELRLEAKLVPWDDPAFIAAFERVRATLEAEGALNGSCQAAALGAQELLRQAGFSAATVECVRTVEDVLRRTAHWIVRRDGPGGLPRG
ncbi:MAG: hypothetical protein C4343_04105 [Chloroflexota bacterium]